MAEKLITLDRFLTIAMRLSANGDYVKTRNNRRQQKSCQGETLSCMRVCVFGNNHTSVGSPLR